MPRILVAGSTGQIGSELTLALRQRYGKENVVAAGHTKTPSPELADGPFAVLDVSDKDAISSMMRERSIDTVYDLAAVLSATGENDPDLAWRVNMTGLKNVLDVCKELKVAKVFWPSSIAVYGPGAPRTDTLDDAVLTPTTMYGVTKVAGELLANYYFLKHGLDTRCVRYPGLISSETPPGGGTTDYAVAIFYEALQKGRYTCFLREDTVLPMMYMPDAIRGTMELMEAPPASVKRHVGYNLAAFSFSPNELAAEIAKHVKGFTCSYAPDFRQKIADSWPMSIDDSRAREDWGWSPRFDVPTMVRDMLEKLATKIRTKG
jgi:nucleoside-diphosphate-sugar epimerase